MKVTLRSKEIKKILIRKNKSQNWLAHRLEVSSGYMSQLMDGSRNPSPSIRERIMNNLPEHKFDDLFLIKEAESGRMKKPTTIQLKFSVTDDDPLKDEIFKAFGVLMKLLERNNDEVSRTIDQSAKEADKILKEGRKCYG